MSDLFARTLGTFRLTESAREIEIGGHKDRALAAFLCANYGRSFRREYLADLLWPRATEAKAKHSLSQALYAIRRRAPNLLIVRHVISSTAQTDIQLFMRLITHKNIISAAQLITGSFLDCLVIKDAPEFDDWRESFGRSLYLQLEQQLLAGVRQLPGMEQRQIFASIPINVRELMPELEGVANNHAHPAKVKSVYPQEERVTLVDSGSVSLGPLPLVGRQMQLDQISEAWSRSMRGEGQFVLVTGEAGFGKTRLLSEAVFRLRKDSARVIQATCYEPERSVAFGPIRAALSDILDAGILAQLEPIWVKDFA